MKRGLALLPFLACAEPAAPPPVTQPQAAPIADNRHPNVVHGIPGAPEAKAFEFERDAPWSTVSKALKESGAKKASLVTNNPQEGSIVPSHLDLDLEKKPAGTDRVLHLALSAQGSVMLKWSEGSKHVGDVVSSEAQIAKLSTAIEHGWNEKGLHREPSDAKQDRALLHVDPSTPYVIAVIAIDALHAPKRKLNGKDVPAFAITID